MNRINNDVNSASSHSFNPYRPQFDSNMLEQTEGSISKLFQDYWDRMRDFNDDLRKKIKKDNTESLKNKLAVLDLRDINNKDQVSLKYLVSDGGNIKSFAKNNDYDISSIDFTTLNLAIKAAEERLEKIRKGNQHTETEIELNENAYSIQTPRSVLIA